MALDLDASTQKIVDDFDAHAKKRASELMSGFASNETLQTSGEMAFRLGYKAGVVDVGTSLRERHGASVDQMAAVFAAACTWRDASSVPDALAGEINDVHVHEQQLIAAIDAAQKLIAAIDAARKDRP